MNTIIGIFDNAADARRAMDTLRDGPLPLEDISLIARNADGSDAAGNKEDVSAGEGAAVGAVWGGLVGLAALLIPGVGPFIAFGALGAALTGAITGAVVGGITAALVDFSGIPEEDARGYEQEVHSGKTLLAVKARDEDAAEVRRVLTSTGAAVRDTGAAIDSAMAGGPPRVAMYDDRGQRVSDDFDTAAGAATTVGTAATTTTTTTTTTTRRRGIYDSPTMSAASTTSDANATGATGQGWTRGEWVGEGQGSGPRKDTGTFDADQWAGEDQKPGETPGNKWTSGEWVGEGQGSGPRTDTGTFKADQWVGEGQGDRSAEDDSTKRSA